MFFFLGEPFSRIQCLKMLCSKNPTPTQSGPSRLSYRYKVSCRDRVVKVKWVSLPIVGPGCGQTAICPLTPVCVTGQFWQNVKAHSGAVGLSQLAAQSRDCEETDAVNALASLSVGVMSNKR